MDKRVEYNVEIPMYGIYRTRVHAMDEEDAIEVAKNRFTWISHETKVEFLKDDTRTSSVEKVNKGKKIRKWGLRCRGI